MKSNALFVDPAPTGEARQTVRQSGQSASGVFPSSLRRAILRPGQLSAP
ncbi:hypothetical protein [Acetobacter nitrogenifigens]|nr:hypothetical protein [Acetobacter nitrogenifigens]